MRLLRLIVLTIAAFAALAGAAAAESMRYLSFEAMSDAAKWRTGDVTLAIRKGLLSRSVDVLFRRKGSDLPLHPSDAPFDVYALQPLMAGKDPDGYRLYAVDPKAGAKFTGFACEGKAEKSWVAISSPRPYKPLTIYVVRWDQETKAPALCVAMDYRFRGEWKFPPAANRAPQENPYYSTAG
ncbi:MAG TPA: hypothetical protein VEA15_03130 [Caulobacteraceae bacterium]|nr:hypothetical protein [Caulobacteraceae bacterium]